MLLAAHAPPPAAHTVLPFLGVPHWPVISMKARVAPAIGQSLKAESCGEQSRLDPIGGWPRADARDGLVTPSFLHLSLKVGVVGVAYFRLQHQVGRSPF